MINDLKNTWTGRKLAIKICHGIPTVSDFHSLYSTIQSSIVTLKELGQSRYSKEMKDSLLYWCNVVDKADLFVPLLGKKDALKKYDQFTLHTSCFCGSEIAQTEVIFFCNNKNFVTSEFKIS